MKIFLLLSFLFFTIFPCGAAIIQILHTNDLHSYFENSVFEPNVGGYAGLKYMMNEQQKIAKTSGIQTLILDAGDFMEGNLFYMAQNGARTLQIMNKMGYHAVVIGNHDFLMGIPYMNFLLSSNPLAYSLLSANFAVGPKYKDKYKSITDVIRPYRIFNIAGKKVAVIGITTNEVVYSWVIKKYAQILKEISLVKKFAKKLKLKKRVDAVIVLSHLGQKSDRKLAKKSRYIDLIVGGHSHDALFKPVYVKNRKKRLIPIVQTGAHGKYLGKLFLDIDNNKEVKLFSYELLENRDTPKDPTIEKFVEQAQTDLYRKYGKEWLEEVVGITTVELVNSSKKPTLWGHIISDSIRDVLNTDIGVHSALFSGSHLPIGEISRRNLFDAYPRVFKLENQPHGWKIWKVKVRGFLIKFFVKFMLRTKLGLDFSGISFDYVSTSKADEYRIRNARIKGEKIKFWKVYTVALPEGVIMGGLGITRLVKLLLRQIFATDITMWKAMETKVRKIGIITEQYKQSKIYNEESDEFFDDEWRTFVPDRR